ncbi:hypothetical protein [Clostridium sp. YIM B02500]|uniref:hypothetical protein n=1 Tax=Clostridium sp. YIM B02500 TaxID=2910681 RepID=UPI001EEE54E3|nr:hypothetical protein [Clostridium sp. YIM B02500]
MKQPVKISASKKRKLIETQIKLEPSLSSRSIGRQLGVSHVTVEKVRQELIKTG